MAVMLAVVSFGFTACSGDDGDSASASKIEGVWNLTHLKGYKWENYDEDMPRPFTDGAYRVTFRSDGTFLGEKYYEREGWRQSAENLELSKGKYEVGDGLLYLKGEYEALVLKIISFSSNKMVLHDEWEADGGLYWKDLTFTKQK